MVEKLLRYIAMHLETSIKRAEVCLPTKDIGVDQKFFEEVLGFCVEEVFPANAPEVVVLSGYGIRLRLDTKTSVRPGRIRLYISNVEDLALLGGGLIAPNGTEIEFAPEFSLEQPALQHRFEVFHAADKTWVTGRAEMLYRDIVNSHLGSGIIASQIRIPKGGPVPDSVHYHEISFQMIFCCKGWVYVVYEDQGEPILLQPGDCVMQPPKIRHKVLRSSDNLEVIEVAVPAKHLTKIDHDLSLPTDNIKRNRLYSGMKFCYFANKKGTWKKHHLPEFICSDTGIETASNGFARVKFLETSSKQVFYIQHAQDIVLYFILEGTLHVDHSNEGHHFLKENDAFIIPANEPLSITPNSSFLKLLEISFPSQLPTALL